MRSHGVSDFPDPGPDGSFNLSPSAVNSPTFQAAKTTCQTDLSSGATTGQGSSQDLADLVRYANCMRARGVVDFPDPVVRSGQPPGFDFPPNLDVHSPAVVAADKVCHSILPDGGEGHGP